ncbi:putative membrane protein [Sinorhizobium terangae]|nr:putative membrane protein [Sinorhizobium terangae]
MSVKIFALLIGVVAGLCAMTAPAAVCIAADAGWLPIALLQALIAILLTFRVVSSVS